jgi:hypothetical protein
MIYLIVNDTIRKALSRAHTQMQATGEKSVQRFMTTFEFERCLDLGLIKHYQDGARRYYVGITERGMKEMEAR